MNTPESALLQTLEQSAAAAAGSAEPQDAAASLLSAMAELCGAQRAELIVPEHRARGFSSEREGTETNLPLGPRSLILWDEESLSEISTRDLEQSEPRIANGTATLPMRCGAVRLISPGAHFLADESTQKALRVLTYQLDLIERNAYESYESRCRIEGQEKLHTQLLERNMALRESTMLDELTGLYNRRFFERCLSYELERFHRYGHPMGVILVDIDYFKSVNDTHGHQCGDLVLRHVAHVLRETVRTADLVARWGGEELMLLVPDTDLAGCQIVAERLRARVEASPFDVEGKRILVTISLGATSVEGHFNGAKEQVIRITDAALYKAKQEGRNRVHIAPV